MINKNINPLEQFRMTDEQLAKLSWEKYQKHKRELSELLANKALSGATLSQRDRWLIAELLTGKSYPEPAKRGGQLNPDDDGYFFGRFCIICAELENEGVKPSKIEARAKERLAEQEGGRNGINDSTPAKAIRRAIRKIVDDRIADQTRHNYNLGN